MRFVGKGNRTPGSTVSKPGGHIVPRGSLRGSSSGEVTSASSATDWPLYPASRYMSSKNEGRKDLVGHLTQPAARDQKTSPPFTSAQEHVTEHVYNGGSRQGSLSPRVGLLS